MYNIKNTWLLIVIYGLFGSKALATPDVDCLIDQYNAYIERHSEAFLDAGEQMAQQAPDHYEQLDGFIDYQLRSNTLKAYVVAYLGNTAPRYLRSDEVLAHLAPRFERGSVHQLLMRDPSFRDSYQEWARDTERYIQGKNQAKADWQALVEARNLLNRYFAASQHYPAVVQAYQRPLSALCPNR